jgi:hypothetical protein
LLPPHWKRICEDLKVKERTMRRFILWTILNDEQKLSREWLGEKVESLVPQSLPVDLNWTPVPEPDQREAVEPKAPRCESQDDLVVCSLLLTICQEYFRDPAWHPDDFYRNWVYSLLDSVQWKKLAIIREYGQLKKEKSHLLTSFNKAHFHLPPRKKVNRPRRRRSSEDRHGTARISKAGVPPEVRKMYDERIERFATEDQPTEIKERLYTFYNPSRLQETTLVEVQPLAKSQYWSQFRMNWRNRLAGNELPRESEEETPQGGN